MLARASGRRNAPVQLVIRLFSRHPSWVEHVGALFAVLDEVCRVPERPISAPMRMPISGIYRIKDVGDVLAGRVEQATGWEQENFVGDKNAVLLQCRGARARRPIPRRATRRPVA